MIKHTLLLLYGAILCHSNTAYGGNLIMKGQTACDPRVIAAMSDDI